MNQGIDAIRTFNRFFTRHVGAIDARFLDTQAWTESAIENVAGMGRFSSDRTIAEYAHDIWHVKPIEAG